MKVTAPDLCFWILFLLLRIVLAVLMVRRGALHSQPWFCALAGFELVRSAALMVIVYTCPYSPYFYSYFGTLFVDIALVLMVMREIVKLVGLTGSAFTGIIFPALLLACIILATGEPVNSSTAFSAAAIVLDRSLQMFLCCCFICGCVQGMMSGVRAGRIIFCIALGLAFGAAIRTCVDAVIAHNGMAGYAYLKHIGNLGNLLQLTTWIYAFSPTPAPPRLSGNHQPVTVPPAREERESWAIY